MNLWGAIAGAVAGIFLGPAVGISVAGMGAAASGAIVGASLGYTFYDQPQMAKAETKSAEKKQRAAAEAQLKYQLAGQYDPIDPEQMRMQMGQRQIESLTDALLAQETKQPTVYTLPTAQPSSPVERINQAIGQLLKGAA